MSVPAKLAVGPMSRQIIRSVFSYSALHGVPMMLICSKSQIDFDSGYVFTTREYRTFLNQLKSVYPTANVFICRDHCGPGHNSNFDLADTYSTIAADLENKFDLIHVDFCLHQGSYQEILDESKKAIEYILSQAPLTRLEVGTDENTGTNIEQLPKTEEEMKYFTSFCKPDFFVCQTGTLIKETNQAGSFHMDHVKNLRALADQYGLAIKEHNADYLPAEEIRKRQGLVGAVNVAPQYGVLQTQLTLYKAFLYGLDPSEFLEVSYKSGKWKKWMDKNTADNKMLCSVIAGHYNFNHDSYRRLFEGISAHENFEALIETEMHKQFDLYLHNLEVTPVVATAYHEMAA